MGDSQKSNALFERVGRRLRLDAMSESFFLWLLVGCGVYAVLLLVSRLLGLIPDVFDVRSLGAIFAVAAALCWLLYRRPSTAEAARKIDGHHGSKDLFLTVALLDKSAAEFKPLVVSNAESRAASIKPGEVVPFRWGQRLGRAAIALLIVWGGLHLKQLDPFGTVEAAEEAQGRKQEVAKSRKATRIRTAQIKKDADEAKQGEDVREALDELKRSFKKMKPREKKENFKALATNQKLLGEKWRKLSKEKLKQLLSQSTPQQRFGSANNEKLEKWARELQDGSTDSLAKEFSELQEELKRLQKATDPVEKAAIKQRIKKRLKDLEDFASKKMDSKQLSAALKRAMKQLESSKFEGLSEQSLEGLSESLELSKLELEELAQSAKDLKALEEALKVLQMAKQLNDKEKLDGEACENCTSMADYEEMYAEMIAQMGGLGEGGEGEGMRGPGIGRGGKAPEDDSVATNFKTELSKSQVTAGKVLLSLKTKGLSHRGNAAKNYRGLIRSVKQGISEAIETEQIPPGYHEGIKNYFDNIESSAPKSDGKGK